MAEAARARGAETTSAACGGAFCCNSSSSSSSSPRWGPFQPELAVGAVGEDGAVVVDEVVARDARVRPGEVDAAERPVRVNVLERSAALRRGRPVSVLLAPPGAGGRR